MLEEEEPSKPLNETVASSRSFIGTSEGFSLSTAPRGQDWEPLHMLLRPQSAAR